MFKKGKEDRIFDTNVLVDMLRGNSELAMRVFDMPSKHRYISEITALEVLYGAYVSGDVEKELEKTKYLLRHFKKLSLIGAEEIFSEKKFFLRKKGKPIEDFDLMIAATALANDMTLVTGNIRHFERVEGLMIENWKK